MSKEHFYDRSSKAIGDASKAYYDMREKCDKVAILAKECIDWTDGVSCDYMPCDGVCIQIDEMAVPASRFFTVAMQQCGIVDRKIFEELSC